MPVGTETAPVSCLESIILPIRQFGVEGTRHLAKVYWMSRDTADQIEPQNMSKGEGFRLGYTDIYELTLLFLGQHHLIQKEAPNAITVDHVQPITERQVAMLAQLYRTVRTACLAGSRDSIEQRKWLGDITAQEARIWANAHQLKILLTDLGQGLLEKSIDREVKSKYFTLY